MIKSYLKATETERMYIFIDDLDRLEPVRAVELLEGIKNFLDIPQCVFMLAIDTKVVEEGLKEKYGANMDEKKMVRFFDKIIQVPYKLPVHNYKLDEFMKNVLERYVKEEGKTDVKIDEIAPKYVEFLDAADIHNPRTIKRCVNFCLLHKYMDGNDYEDKDKDIYFHRFVIKMLELENEKEYWMILAQVRSSGEDYTDIRDWLLGEEKLKFRLFHEVLKSFEIDENADVGKVKLFADYIIRSAPSDILTLKYLGAAQKAYEVIQWIVKNRKNLDNIEARVSPMFEKTDIAKISTVEIARIFEENEYILIHNSILKIYIHQRPVNQNLTIQISGGLLKPNDAIKLLKTYNQAQSREDIIDYRGSNIMHFIINIKDTSSPDAPIYKILEKAGILDNANDKAPVTV